MVNWAHAPRSPGGEGGGMDYQFPAAHDLHVGDLYFLLIRPQQKKAKEHQPLLDNLKRGDRLSPPAV